MENKLILRVVLLLEVAGVKSQNTFVHERSRN